MIIKFIFIMLATFLTCWIYYAAAMAAMSSIKIRVKKDERRG